MLDSLSFPRLDVWRKHHWRAKPVAISPEFCIVARLKIVDKNFWIDGAVLDLDGQSALFREASAYVLRRQHEEVILEIESSEYPAVIDATDQYGYRLALLEPLPEEVIADLRDRWRIDA